MKFSDLISKIFTSKELELIQGIEKKLRSRKRSERNGLYFLAATILFGVVRELAGADVFQWSHLINFRDVIAFIFKGKWDQAFLYDPVWELLFIGFVLILLLFYLLLVRSRFLAVESEEPFRYTFWVDNFKEVKDTPPKTLYTLDRSDRFNLLHHDLMEKLNLRIKRLSLLNLDGLTADGSKKGPAYFESVRELQSKLVAHIQIDGTYSIREDKDNDWVIHVMPRVRIGSLENPSILAYSVKFPLERDNTLTARQYNQFIERVYSRVATEVYKQIELDVHEKMKLFPTSRMRALALFNEAEDFATSNTIDAYDRAIALYREALRYFEISQISSVTSFFIRSVFWRIKAKAVYQQSRMQIGFIKCLIFRRIVSTLTGRYSNPLFEIRPILEKMLDRLKKLHDRFPKSAKDPLPIFFKFPKDTWLRHRVRFIVPSELVFEKRSKVLFDAYLVAALGYFYLESYSNAPQYLIQAKSVNPKLSARNPLFLLTAALIEPDLDESILQLRQATELDSDLQIAQYVLAEKSEMLFRMKNEIIASRVVSVVREYDKVLNINPGNVAALAAQGYLWWLVGDLSSAKKKFEEGYELKSIAAETFVGQLTYGLARIAAEEGRFNDSYDLYLQAISADPGIGTYSSSTAIAPYTFYYDQMVPGILKRYHAFQTRVMAHRKRQIRSTAEFRRDDLKDPIGLIIKLKLAKSAKDDQLANGDKNDVGDDKVAKADKAVNADTITIQMFIRERFDEKTKKLFGEIDSGGQESDEIRNGLIGVLNKVVKCRDFYDTNRFNGVILSEEAHRLIRQNPRDGDVARLNRLLLEEAFPNELLKSEDVSTKTINTVLSYVLNDHGNACLGYYARFGEDSKLDEAINTFRKVRKLDRENIIVYFNQYLGYTRKGTGNKDSNPFDNIEKILLRYPNQPVLVFALAQNILREPEEIREKEKQLEEYNRRSTIKPEKQLKQIDSTNEMSSKLTTGEIKQHRESTNPTVGRKSKLELENEIASLRKSWTNLVVRVKELSIKNSKFSSLSDKLESGLEELNTFFSTNKISAERLDENDVRALKVLGNYLLVTGKVKISSSRITHFLKNIQNLFWPEDFDIDTIFETYEKTPDSNLNERRKNYINYWLKQDPICIDALRWLEPKYFENLTEDIRIQLRRGLDKMSGLRMNNGRYENWVADVYYAFKEYEEASKMYLNATKIDSNVALYSFNLGCAYSGLEDWEKSIDSFKRATDLASGNASYFNYLANAYYHAEDFKNALANYKKAIAINSEVAVFHSNLGLAYNQLREWENAIGAFKNAIELDMVNASYFTALGTAYYNQGDHKNADDLFAKALVVNSNDPAYYYELGNALYQHQQWIKAIRFYERAIELDPKNAEYFNSVGLANYMAKDYKGASINFQKTIEFAPNVAVYHYNLGLAKSERRERQESIKHFKKATQLDSGTAKYFNGLGNAYFNSIDYRNASKNYKKAIEIDSNIALYYSNIISAFEKNKQTQQSDNWFRSALEEKSKDVKFIYDLGTTLGQYGLWKKAIQALLKTISLDPNNSVYYSDLGNAYDQIFEKEDAAEQFLKAFKLDPENLIYLQNLIKAADRVFPPAKAIFFVEDALVTDPDNTNLKDELKKLKERLLDYNDQMASLRKNIK